MTAGPGLSHDEFAEKVAASIKEYFTRDLGRPELLNRIGDNIVVFDFITPEVGLRILSQMLGRLSERVEQEYKVKLLIDPGARATIAESCVNEATLELGGRGIGSKLETVVVNPLANNFFVHRPVEGSIVSIAKIESTSLGWEIETRCD
jgi:ATP-dependent Clp protease ATP-binding subunit ClpA